MTLPLGLNIFTWNDATRAICDQLQPAALLFLDNDGGAAEAANRYPNCKVIARIVNDSQEKHLHEHQGDTRRYLQQRASQVPRNVYINLGCEAPINNLSALISETVDGLNWASQNGIKVAAPHGAWYGINPEHFADLDPLADIICRYPNLFILTMDEYSGGHAFSGVVDPSIAGGNEVGHIHYWKAGPTPEKWQDTQFWHSGRITNYFRYRKALGKPLPPTVITEMGMDTLSDINAWLSTLKNTGTQDKVRGYKTLSPQWHEWYGDPDVAYAQMLAAQWREIYSPWSNIIGECIFVWGTNGDRQWNSYRVDGNSAFFNQVIKEDWKAKVIVVNPVSKPANAGTPTHIGLLVTPTYINGREAPTTSSTNNVKQVLNNTPIQRYSGGEVIANGYKWSWVEVLNNLTDKVVQYGRWMALVSTSWDAQIVAPIPTPEKPVFLPPRVFIATPFSSQYNNVDGPNGCGPALLAALVNFVEKEKGSIELLVDADDTSKTMKRVYGATTTIRMIIDAGLAYGISLFTTLQASPDLIQRELDDGRIVGILYKRGAITGELAIYNFAGSHFGWIVGYGYTDKGVRYFLLNEPLQTGTDPEPLNVIESELITALLNKDSGNLANQAIFIDPETLSSPFTKEQTDWLKDNFVSK